MPEFRSDTGHDSTPDRQPRPTPRRPDRPPTHGPPGRQPRPSAPGTAATPPDPRDGEPARGPRCTGPARLGRRGAGGDGRSPGPRGARADERVRRSAGTRRPARPSTCAAAAARSRGRRPDRQGAGGGVAGASRVGAKASGCRLRMPELAPTRDTTPSDRQPGPTARQPTGPRPTPRRTNRPPTHTPADQQAPDPRPAGPAAPGPQRRARQRCRPTHRTGSQPGPTARRPGSQHEPAAGGAQPAGRANVLISRYSSSPATPISRPMPDCLYPPNGASAPYHMPPLMLTVPVRRRRATAVARSSSAP